MIDFDDFFCFLKGMIRILIAAINFFSERRDKSLLLEGVEEKIEDITNKLYVVLAALIKGNRTNCSNFAQSARLNWLVSRLQSQQASRGVLEVLHSVLVDSPEVLNMITESHILASMLFTHVLYKRSSNTILISFSYWPIGSKWP
jgi:hypothetical protein